MSLANGKLSNKVAVVTGASRGLGSAIAMALAEAGASVTVNFSSDDAGAATVVKAIQAAGGTAIGVRADLRNGSEIVSLFETVAREFGRLDVLVNNAGMYHFGVPLAEVTAEDFREQFDLNVLALLLATKEAVRHIAHDGGSIVNVGALSSTTGYPGAVVYNATKGAVDAITLSLANELGARKIRVNAIKPGLVTTERAMEFVTDEMTKSLIAHTPLGRIAEPADIAPAAVFFASDDSKFITGRTLIVSGGLR